MRLCPFGETRVLVDMYYAAPLHLSTIVGHRLIIKNDPGNQFGNIRLCLRPDRVLPYEEPRDRLVDGYPDPPAVRTG